ncbi:MAG: hypothetical protein ETSY1_35050 [Candidatus Entotheonella factor]|uniref:Uncharacterized protein n=1 Tax=Entotheonella factor TaxID=1429438 RepID=W4L8R4_ENTF1|nr:MAG: hypothetical protein ETSY1_35050 [Candidatus Entotheonella factor]
MARLALKLVNFSGQQLNRSGYSGSGNWNPPPPASLDNGMTYGPFYLITGSLFIVELSYVMNTLLELGTGTNLFDLELFTDPDPKYKAEKPIYSAGYGMYLNFKRMPVNHSVAYQSDKTPDCFHLTLVFQGSPSVESKTPTDGKKGDATS